jgi:hypothetical protein
MTMSATNIHDCQTIRNTVQHDRGGAKMGRRYD